MGDSDTEEMPQNSTETEDFNFDEWATGLGLNRKVTQILRQEELTSKTALKLLQLKDLKELGLPLGSVKIIENEIQTWNKVSDIPNKLVNSEKDTSNMDINSEILSGAGKTLDVLLSDQPPVSNKSKPELFGQMDPRTILTLKSQTNKAVHITQFLTEKCKRRRQSRRKEFVLKSGAANSETLVLKADEEHPYLGIFIEEWGAANMRLLNHLLATQKLCRNDIEFYLAYTTKIFEFAEKYEWNSVLNYDYAYRELQAEHQFQWGTFSPNMELQLLIPKRSRQGVNTTAQSSLPTEDCKLFKARGSCPFGSSCKYRHTKVKTPYEQVSEPKGPKNL